MVIVTEISEESSSFSSTYDYDVFLSFRCTDTRYNFTDHLHKALLEASVDTFLDDAEIQTGEDLKPELENAIKASRASIIVLSMDYASSTWCLDELVLILEQRRSSKHTVFPIFYNVKPTDVRKQRSSFGDAMTKHKQRMDVELDAKKRSQLARKVKQWEKALTEVADLKGEEANGSRLETILIEGIVKEISNRLDLHKRSKIPHLIGQKSSIRTITSFLKDRSSGSTEFLTIWGMAGIGKTYLAEYIFKLHYRDFERSCFLEDIERKCTLPDGLLDLQKVLLKDIREGSWMDINSTKAGTYKIEKSLLRRKTLLVLDGIDKFEQLDVLLGTEGLHHGSKVIITSKNGSITEKCTLFKTKDPPKHTKHLLNGLNQKDSLQLLSWHASRSNDPKEGYEKESMKVVEYCNGHPLALKVLGSSLYTEDATWEVIIETLGNEINPSIKKALQISLESLPYEKDKELFKHIACFFVGKDRKFSEEILKACGICNSFGIKNLTNRCLLTISSNDKLTMHQLLQDIGRDIVLQESPHKPWKRSLLWKHEESLKVLQHKKGLVLDMRTFENKTSRGSSSANKREPRDNYYRSSSLIDWVHVLFSFIWWLFGWVMDFSLSFHRQKGEIETVAFSEMCNLRILHVNYVHLNGSFKNLPEGLRWLSMHGFSLSYIPSDLQLSNLVALDMSNSNLRKLWKKPKFLGSLKFLNLSCCHDLVGVGDFSGLLQLERLILAGCTSLLEVGESIGKCGRLVLLDMSDCNKLKRLPRSIGKLKKLRTLLINGCLDLGEFPAEMKNMESLEVLEANNINIVSQVSSSAIVEAIPRSFKPSLISLPSSLVTLSLINNNLSNESFPVDFSSLSMLKNLHFDKNPIDSLPDCVRSLSRLQNLSLHGCRRLKTILCAPNTIIKLNMDECYSLEKITFFPEPTAAALVMYSHTFSLTEVQDKFKMQAISEIDEEILNSLGWINIEYVISHQLMMACYDGIYKYIGAFLPAQILYEHGIFSTYLQGQEVPDWFTYKSKGTSVTLQSDHKNRRIRGLNLSIVSTISNTMLLSPSRISIRNLTKNCSWIYQPISFVRSNANDEVIIWLSHWMFGNNEFEGGDEVSVHVSVKLGYGDYYDRNCNGGEGSGFAHLREYGISLVYGDENKKDDPLAYYKSWTHIITRDISAAKLYSSDYLLKPLWPYLNYDHLYPQKPYWPN